MVGERGAARRADRAQRRGPAAPAGQGGECDERAQVDGQGPPGCGGTGPRPSCAAEQLVPGDIVILAAGEQVPADGRIIAASALQIDESALTGESTPAAKDAGVLPDCALGPGDQTNMAFMNAPVTHGSGVLVVTGTGADTELARLRGRELAAGPGQELVAARVGIV